MVKISFKKIKRQDDIEKLVRRDIVKISGFGRMLLDNISKDRYIFIGKESADSIAEVSIKKEDTYPGLNGYLGIRANYWGGSYPKEANGDYFRLNKKLLRAGIIRRTR